MEFRFMLKSMMVAGAMLGLTTTVIAADKKPATMTGASATMLANTCNGCHGPKGASAGPASPTIAGISEEYFIETMQGFASGEIPSTIMGRIAKGYSEDELKAMAGFFSKEKFIPAASQKFDKKLAGKGAKLHEKYCEKCHADGGTSAEDDSGILAGQWSPYLEMTLSDYNKGDRIATKKMAKKLKKLHKKKGDAGIEALINYYASENK